MFNIFKKASYFREFKCTFKISFPVKDGYVETAIIHSKINADSKESAKNQTEKWARKKLKISFIEIN